MRAIIFYHFFTMFSINEDMGGVRVGDGTPPFGENASGQVTAFCRLGKTCQGEQKILVCSLLPHWGTKIHLLVAHFCVGERKNFCSISNIS